MTLRVLPEWLTALSASAVMLAFTLPGVAGSGTNVSQALPASCSKTLEQASSALVDGQFADAARGFESVAADTNVPPFARGVALFGLARECWERKDAEGAIETLTRLADDAQLPAAHRDAAQRWIGEIERQRKGLPARDPAAYRASLPALGKPGVIFHVANASGGSADGSEARPFLSLQQARDAIRRLKQSFEGSLPPGGVRVLVHGGTYPVSATLELGVEDSGTSNAPVVYQANPGDMPVFSGGVRIRNWKPVSDPKVSDKLDPAARGRVMEADIGSLGIKDLGDPTVLRQAPELFCDGVPQTLARWPNEGFIKIAEALGSERITNGAAIDGCKDGKFRYLDDRPAQWLDEPDVRLYGYWYWDWFEEFQKVAQIDPTSHAFTLAAPYSRYGYRKGQRYRAVNVFREIDQPGEWYLDRQTAKLYWLPPDGTDLNRAVATVSCFSRPFAALKNAENIILQGLIFEEGRGDAIHIQGGADCLVAGCTMRQFGGDAVVIDGGRHHGVFGCAIYRMGCGGIQARGGDRKTLTPGRHFVENCTVSDISRLQRTYTPAVLLDGCGNRIAHNLFERMPSSALRIEGNDQLIELNLIRHVVQESDDQGGLDMFGNPLYRGVVIRWNYWGDIGGGTHCGAAGVRLDDMISGVAICGNVFERCGTASFGGVQIHGGKENLVDGNLFLDCYAGVTFSGWGEKRWLDSIKGFLPQAGAPPYSQHYPGLARIKQDADMNFASRNLFSRCSSFFLRDAGKQRVALNLATERRIEPALLSDDRSIRTDPQLHRLLMEPIPFGEIGPYAHSWRVSLNGGEK